MAPPPRSSFVGRDADLEAVRVAVDGSPIVTLTGPPGVGKTRLAVEVASRQAERFADGVAVVALAAADSRGAALAAIGQSLMGAAAGRPTSSQLAAYVGRRSLLLLLDDLDGVVEIGADVAELVAACPRLRVLATSRERLNVSTEREHPVPPLATPTADDRLDLGRLRDVPAVRLLVERAESVAPGFGVDADNADAIAALCAGLDGLPLAYELVAPQLKAFSPGELAERLGNRFALAAVGPRDIAERHRTLRTAIGWSHDLLPPTARAVFRRASVFAAPWTAREAAAVCLAHDQTEHDIHELLLALVDRSLLHTVTRPDGATGYVMLDSIRAFAVEALAADDDADATRARHTAHFAGLARIAEASVGAPDEVESVAVLAAMGPDLTAAGLRAVDAGDLEAAAWLAAACGWAGYLSGDSQVDLLHRVLDLDLAGISPPAYAALHGAAGVTDFDQGRFDDARGNLAQALRLSESNADRRRQAIARAFLGHVARRTGQLDEAEAHYRASGGYFAEVGDEREPRGADTTWACSRATVVGIARRSSCCGPQSTTSATSTTSGRPPAPRCPSAGCWRIRETPRRDGNCCSTRSGSSGPGATPEGRQPASRPPRTWPGAAASTRRQRGCWGPRPGCTRQRALIATRPGLCASRYAVRSGTAGPRSCAPTAEASRSTRCTPSRTRHSLARGSPAASAR